jgi:hypothetical protein
MLSVVAVLVVILVAFVGGGLLYSWLLLRVVGLLGLGLKGLELTEMVVACNAATVMARLLNWA